MVEISTGNGGKHNGNNIINGSVASPTGTASALSNHTTNLMGNNVNLYKNEEKKQNLMTKSMMHRIY